MGAEREVGRHFGANLRRARRAADLSQEALGFRAGLHRTEVGLLERGVRGGGYWLLGWGSVVAGGRLLGRPAGLRSLGRFLVS